MKIRLKDIAKLANVSETTVSLVLNDKPCRVSAEKKAEIRELAKQLNYIPNMMATALAKKKSKIIGIIVPDIENPFFSTLSKAISQELYQQNYFTILENSNNHFEMELALIDQLVNLGVDGLFISLSTESYTYRKEMVAKLSDLPIPFVLLDRTYKKLVADQISFDNQLGGQLATDALLQKGHREIGFIMDNQQLENIEERLNGYKKALNESQFSALKPHIFQTPFSFEGGYQIAEKVFKQREITAVVVANDMLLFGFLKRASELSIRIPEKISVVGYDYSLFSKMYPIAITSVVQNIEELAKAACKLLHKRLSQKEVQASALKLRPELILGESIKVLTPLS